MKSWFQTALSKEVLLIAIRTSLVVGTVLNLINFGPELWNDWQHMSAVRIVLNYCVPYVVATYGAVSFARRGDSGRE